MYFIFIPHYIQVCIDNSLYILFVKNYSVMIGFNNFFYFARLVT